MYAFAWLTAMLAAYGIVTLVKRHAETSGLIDVPGARSAHSAPTPTGGGLSIVGAFAGGAAVFHLSGAIGQQLWSGVAVPALLVAGVGYFDDRTNTSIRVRLGVHFLAASLCLWAFFPQVWTAGGGIAWALLPVGLVAMVWLVNLYNFMDGIDGIAASEAVFVAVAASLLLLPADGEFLYLLALVGGASASFLAFNWKGARIFMGDTGSGFLGFVFAALAVATVAAGALSPWTWVILLGVFIVDATYTLLRRMVSGCRWWLGHNTHAYQILARRWNSHHRVTAGMSAINLCWLFPLAWVAERADGMAEVATAAALTPLVYLAHRAGAGRT